MPLLAIYLTCLIIVSVLCIASCVFVSHFMSLTDHRHCRNTYFEVPVNVAKFLGFNYQTKPKVGGKVLAENGSLNHEQACSPAFHLNNRKVLNPNCQINYANFETKTSKYRRISKSEVYFKMGKILDRFSFIVCFFTIFFAPIGLFQVTPRMASFDLID